MAAIKPHGDSWIKPCLVCKKQFITATVDEMKTHFCRASRRFDGLDNLCKSCENERTKRKRQGRGSEIHMRRYRRDKIKVRARQKAQAAVREGKLIRGVCFCGEAKTEGHHPDYTKPLEVVWLCKKHHREEHKKILALDAKQGEAARVSPEEGKNA